MFKAVFNSWVNFHYRKPLPGECVIIVWEHMGDKHFKHTESYDGNDFGFLEDVEFVFWKQSPF